MKYHLTLLFLFITIAFHAESIYPSDKWKAKYQELQEQNFTPDSLQIIISSLEFPEKDRVYFDLLLMNAYGNNWEIEKCDSLYSNISSTFAKRGNKLMVFETTYTWGSYLNTFNKYTDAYSILSGLMENLISYDNKEKNKQYLESIQAKAYYEMAYSLLYLNDFEKANQHIEKSIDLFMQVNDSVTLIDAYNLSGLLYKKQFRLDKAIERYQQAIEMSDKSNNDRHLLITRLYAQARCGIPVQIRS